MSIRSVRHRSRGRIHKRMADPGYFCASPAGDAWTPVGVREITKGANVLDEMVGAFEVFNQTPILIFKISETPGASEGSLIVTEYGVFKLDIPPPVDRDGYVKVRSTRLSDQEISKLTAAPPVIDPPVDPW
ncbi:hypothetical protein TW83_09960 [Paracoccus sp. S4493]|uniref:hypothetical protein n=1 Tax=Paracoccus sp. S4493 TaxID=579490 RepID=UPI0005FA58E5|nr:hypothetical protein [Paracoccus sp. S4493]KJZ31237.1 hypothetical protein TW83_09960 [Paracoccus sp. S4493]